MTSPPQLTLTLPPATLQLPPATFSPNTPHTQIHVDPSLEALQNRMCDPLVIYHSCGHISEFSCSIGRSFQPDEVHTQCTFNVPPMEELGGVCGICIGRGTLSSDHSSHSSTSEQEVIELERGDAYPQRAEEVVVPLRTKVGLRFRGLRLNIRGRVFRAARVECEVPGESQTLKGEYRELIVAFGKEAEKIWLRTRERGKRIRGWALRAVREDDEEASDREIVGRLVGRLSSR